MKKNFWVLFLFVILGILAGTFVGHALTSVEQLAFLTKTMNVDFSPAVDFIAFKFALNVTISMNILSIVGAVVAIWIYRKIK